MTPHPVPTGASQEAASSASASPPSPRTARRPSVAEVTTASAALPVERWRTAGARSSAIARAGSAGVSGAVGSATGDGSDSDA